MARTDQGERTSHDASDSLLIFPYIARSNEAEYAVQMDEDDDASADEEDLATKIAILERLRGRRGMYIKEPPFLVSHVFATELEQALGIPFPVGQSCGTILDC